MAVQPPLTSSPRRLPEQPAHASVRRVWPLAEANAPIAAAPHQDPVDLVVGRAYLDPDYQSLLHRDPKRALADVPMSLELKRALIKIQADDLLDFARQALAAAAAVDQARLVRSRPRPLARPAGSIDDRLAQSWLGVAR